ncbi:MAG: hypothetical protein Q9218_002239 [Villophora microphyllina]
MLEALDLCDNDTALVHIEQAQAWILVTFYELLRTNSGRASLSAGRVFRLVQLLRLHEIDYPTDGTGQFDPFVGADWVATEEKRRTFWVAYCLDSDHNLYSPLAECAILATISGRALSHNQVSTVERVYGNASLDFWIRHEWLDSMLARRMETFLLNHPAELTFTDPMLLFSFMMMQTTIIYLSKIMEPFGMEEEYKATVAKMQDRALSAASEIARLSKEQGHIGYFKASQLPSFLQAMRAMLTVIRPTSSYR